MPLENHDHSGEEANKPKPKPDSSGFLGKHLSRTLLAAGLALGTPALAADAPTKEEKVQLQKAQLDKEIAENAGALEALREDSTLDSPLGATGLNPSTMNSLGTTISPRGTELPPKSPAQIDRAKSEKVQLQKAQLDKEIAENAGALGALREDSEESK